MKAACYIKKNDYSVRVGGNCDTDRGCPIGVAECTMWADGRAQRNSASTARGSPFACVIMADAACCKIWARVSLAVLVA